MWLVPRLKVAVIQLPVCTFETSRATVEMLRKHGFDVAYSETPGGHTWINWRDYLIDFSQRLFR